MQHRRRTPGVHLPHPGTERLRPLNQRARIGAIEQSRDREGAVGEQSRDRKGAVRSERAGIAPRARLRTVVHRVPHEVPHAVTVKKASKTGERPLVHGRCQTCAAPLRGFPGDFAKCRACRRMTMLSADPPAGWRTVRDPARLQALPAAFIVMFYAAIAAFFWTGGGTDLVGGAVVVIVLSTWIFSIMQFAKAAERQRGWWLPVIEYHVAGVFVILSFWMLVDSVMAMLRSTAASLTLLTLVLSVFALFVCTLVCGDARRRIAHLRIVRDG